MTVALRSPRMTREEFLTWVEGQEGRYEFDGFEPVGSPGETVGHGIVVGNLIGQIHTRLRGKTCRLMTSSGGGVATIGNAVRYPDATVTCSRLKGTERLVPDPVVVFEVLSTSSMRLDQGEKPTEYGAVPSIQRYVIVEQAKAEVRGYVRIAGGEWAEMNPLQAGATLHLPEIGMVLPLSDVYEDVVFEA